MIAIEKLVLAIFGSLELLENAQTLLEYTGRVGAK